MCTTIRKLGCLKNRGEWLPEDLVCPPGCFITGFKAYKKSTLYGLTDIEIVSSDGTVLKQCRRPTAFEYSNSGRKETKNNMYDDDMNNSDDDEDHSNKRQHNINFTSLTGIQSIEVMEHNYRQYLVWNPSWIEDVSMTNETNDMHKKQKIACGLRLLSDEYGLHGMIITYREISIVTPVESNDPFSYLLRPLDNTADNVEIGCSIFDYVSNALAVVILILCLRMVSRSLILKRATI